MDEKSFKKFSYTNISMFEINIFFYLGLLVISFIVLLKSSDYLVTCASILGDRAGISKFTIGLSIIAIGTSLPELMTAIFGIISSDNGTAFVLGTVIGSNITNILLVFAALIFFSNGFIFKKRIFNTIYLLLSTFLLLLFVILNTINLFVGILFLTIFASYLYYGLTKENPEEVLEEVHETESVGLNKFSTFFLSSILVLSIVFLNLGAKGVVAGIENIGSILHIPIYFLTLTTVSFATSLPELAVTYHAAKKNEIELAIGNIFGSNISNILLIVGVSSILTTLKYDISEYLLGLSFLVISTFLFISLQYIQKTKRIIGLGFFSLYLLYIFLLFF